jgi:two-component system nitrogen regulation response regulator NtrX
MPDIDGIEVLRVLRQSRPALPVIILSGHGTVARAVEATRLGAFDFLEKPIDSEKIVITLENALERSRLEKDRQYFINDSRERFPLIGRSKAIQDLLALATTVAASDSKVLLTGESGTGKELVARTIHLHSRRAAAPFLAVNFAAIPEDLIESELFGHEKGAFTGAQQRLEGKFEQAADGTLFMDEVGDMSLRMQAKVLRAIEENEIQPLGSKHALPVDARIIAASNRDLRQAVHAKSFREDLYYRLNVVNICVPPLRDRKEDIPALVEHFMQVFSQDQKRPSPCVTPESLAVLMGYSWPGNVRELRNFTEKLFVFCSGRNVSREEMTKLLSGSTLDGQSIDEGIPSLSEARSQAEREAILKALTANEWNYEETARDLFISRATLFAKVKQYSIKRPPR